MKKILNIKNLIFIFIGIIIGTLGYVVADNVVSIINANQVGFSSSKTTKTNIQEAIDELYEIANKNVNIELVGNATGATIEPKTGAETYDAVVYLDPTNLAKNCNAKNSAENIGKTNQKSGCMKWYAYNTRTVADKTMYDLILDHNSTAIVAWANEEDYKAAGGTNWNSTNGSNDKGPVTINKELSNLIANGWKVMPRMITADEIAHIVGVDVTLSWDSTSNNIDNWFYLDGTGDDKHTIYPFKQEGKMEKSEYSWLYDNTYKCTGGTIEYGCKIPDDATYGTGVMNGYWTSTKLNGNSSYVWRINRDGSLYTNNANYQYFGLRPVITITKTALEI